MLRGIGASEGIAIGKAVVIRPLEVDVVRHTVLCVEDEKKRFLDAVEVFVSQLEAARQAMEQKVGGNEAMILGAQVAIIQDPELIREVLRTIERQQVNAEYAFHLICNGYIALFSHIEDKLMAARSADFRDIRDRMLRILLDLHDADLSALPAGSILVADDVAPSQTAAIDPERTLGILTRHGTLYSHIAIIARALQLPTLVAVEGLFEAVRGGETLILDAYNGKVWIDPKPEVLALYRRRLGDQRQMRQALEAYRGKPTLTADSHRVGLAANLAVEQELDAILPYQVDGIGLYRTEFLYMGRLLPPAEEEQYQVYRKLAEALQGKPVMIRTLDIGGDKDIPCLKTEQELNPYLGHRAIRYCLDRPDIFKPQLAALLQAGIHGNVQIMLPMISSLSELLAVKKLLEDIKEEMARRRIPFGEQVKLGIMVETPAAALCARELARECDFFSIGTNDLTQYALAVDRGNSSVAALYNPLHPAVLRLVAMAVEGAHEAGIPVGVCGEAAADPLMIPFLIGLGVDSLSVNSGSLLPVRRMVSRFSKAEWQGRIPEILSLSTAKQVQDYIVRQMDSAPSQPDPAPSC